MSSRDLTEAHSVGGESECAKGVAKDSQPIKSIRRVSAAASLRSCKVFALLTVKMSSSARFWCRQATFYDIVLLSLD